MRTQRPSKSPLSKSYLEKNLNSYTIIREARPQVGYLSRYRRKTEWQATNTSREVDFQKLVQPDYQKVRYPNAVFEGQMVYNLASKRYVRHGQGVLLLADGTTIIGKWEHNKLQGAALIFCPEGGLVYCEFVSDRPNGWMIYQFEERYVVCQLYHLGKLKEGRYRYEAQLQRWAYNYRHESKTESCEYGRLPSLIASQQLQKKLSDFYRKSFLLNLTNIRTIVSQPLMYMGYADRNGQPSGLGIIRLQKESYAGYFSRGELHHCGRILFSNGDVYVGEFRMGAIQGQGSYFNAESNSVVVAKHSYKLNRIQKHVQNTGDRGFSTAIPFVALPDEDWVSFEERATQQLGLSKVREVMKVWVSASYESKPKQYKVEIAYVKPAESSDQQSQHKQDGQKDDERMSLTPSPKRTRSQLVPELLLPNQQKNRSASYLAVPQVLADFESVAVGPSSQSDGLNVPRQNLVNVSLKEQKFDTLAGNHIQYDIEKAQLTFRRQQPNTDVNPYKPGLQEHTPTTMQDLNHKLEALVTSIPKKKRIFGATNIARINFE